MSESLLFYYAFTAQQVCEGQVCIKRHILATDDCIQIIKNLNINVLAVLHDIQLAGKFSDYIYLMKGGEVKYEGEPRTTITEKSMKDIYDINCKISWSNDNQAMIEYI